VTMATFTFLTNRRMSAELARRVEASVSGKRSARAGDSPRVVAFARIAVVLGVAASVYGLFATRHHDRARLEQSRKELLDAVAIASASLTEKDHELVVRVDETLVRLAREYEGDVLAPSVRSDTALRATLARRALYIRGAIAEFSNPVSIATASSASRKDAFLLCLMDPPAARTEAAMLARVRVAYAAGAPAEEVTANVGRLNDARAALPVLSPSWSERVRAAADGAELSRLKRELDAVPIKRAREALRAEILIIAMDEPNEPTGTTELDGEHAHSVRLALIELASSRELLRLRKRVEPSWISEDKRPRYASGLDACALAIDVHVAVGR
jgi:hypothetical protein